MGKFKHGHAKGTFGRPDHEGSYSSWLSLRSRVTHAHLLKHYAHVDMDPRWLDYLVFYADMGDRPEGKTIDRIDGTRGYWPDNCQWATRKEQQNNLGSNIPPEIKEYIYAMAGQISQRDIADVVGYSQASVHRVIQTMPNPPRKYKQHNSLSDEQEKFALESKLSHRAIAKILGCSAMTIDRLFIKHKGD